MKKALLFIFGALISLTAAGVLIGLTAKGQNSSGKIVHAQSDSLLIVKHLTAITKTEGYRNYENIQLLDKTADYIFSVFRPFELLEIRL